MAYVIFHRNVEYGPRDGLEGPFHYPNGRVMYYDPKAGLYWDPHTDFYLSHEEACELNNQVYKELEKV